MKTLTIAATLAAALASPALAHGTTHKHASDGKTFAKGQIVVSCFRGPWEDVIWDRPNAVFIDSLVAVGYDYPTAHAIGERVCRDEKLVNNPGALKATMRRIHREGHNR